MLSTHIQGHQIELLEFGQIDLSLKGIRVLNRVPQSIHFISRLYLDGNHLLSLTGIQQFHNLEVLHVDYNYISLPAELKKIANPFFMKEISFIANPIQNSPILTLEALKKQGFSRLCIVNPPHRLRKHPSTQEETADKNEGQQYLHQNPEQTTRRSTRFRHDHFQTCRKSMIGKIYTYSKQKTVRQHKTRQQTLSRDTRESTGRPDVQSPYPYRQHPKRQIVTPFECNQHQQESIIQEEDASEHFNSGEGTARFESQQQQPSFSQQFLVGQKERLASYYYNRILLEKAFKGLQELSIIEQMEVEQYQGDLINDYLQTLHFSLIKLKQEAVRR